MFFVDHLQVNQSISLKLFQTDHFCYCISEAYKICYGDKLYPQS